MKGFKALVRNFVLLALLVYFLVLVLLISYIQNNKCQSISINNNYASYRSGSDSTYSFHSYKNLLCSGGMQQTIENSLFEANFANDKTDDNQDGRGWKSKMHQHTSSAHSSSKFSENVGSDSHTPNSILIDLTDFGYIINNDICGTKDIYMIIIVHTAPKHFKERQAIRSTWGKPNIFRHVATKVAFLLADLAMPSQTGDHAQYLNQIQSRRELQGQIERENGAYGDIIQGNFIDSYRNLTYKNLMGKKWVYEMCPQARFVLKTDDDMFVDMFQLIEFLEDEYSPQMVQGSTSYSATKTEPLRNVVAAHGDSTFATPSKKISTHPGFEPSSDVPPDLLMCYLFASSPAVSDASHENSKWLVDKSEFGSDLYPPYCSGRAYITTPALAGRMYKASHGAKYFWIDDVYVTGILAVRLGVQHVEVNDLFNLFDPLLTMEWLANGPPEPLRFIFAYSENGHITFYKLWNKTVVEHVRLRDRYRRELLLAQVEKKMASLMRFGGGEDDYMEERDDKYKINIQKRGGDNEGKKKNDDLRWKKNYKEEYGG